MEWIALLLIGCAAEPAKSLAETDSSDTGNPLDTDETRDTAATANTDDSGETDTDSDTGTTGTECVLNAGAYSYGTVQQDAKDKEACVDVGLLAPFGYFLGYDLTSMDDGSWQLEMSGISAPAACVADAACELTCGTIAGEASLNFLGIEANFSYAIDTVARSTGGGTMAGESTALFDCVGREDQCAELEALASTQLPCVAEFTWDATL